MVSQRQRKAAGCAIIDLFVAESFPADEAMAVLVEVSISIIKNCNVAKEQKMLAAAEWAEQLLNEVEK